MVERAKYLGSKLAAFSFFRHTSSPAAIVIKWDAAMAIDRSKVANGILAARLSSNFNIRRNGVTDGVKIGKSEYVA